MASVRHVFPASPELLSTLERLEPRWGSRGILVHSALEYATSAGLSPVKFAPVTMLSIQLPDDWRSRGSREELAGRALAALRCEAAVARQARVTHDRFQVIPMAVPERMASEAIRRSFGKGLTRVDATGELARQAARELTVDLGGLMHPKEEFRPQTERLDLSIVEEWELLKEQCRPLRLQPDTALVLKMREIQGRRR